MNMLKKSEFIGHASALYALCIGMDENTFFSAGADKLVAQWTLNEVNALPFSIRTEHSVYSLCFIKELNFLVIGQSAGGIHIICLGEKKEIKHFAYHNKGIYALQFNSKYQQLYASSGDGSFSVWDLKSLKHLRTLYLCEGKIRSMALNNDQSLLAVGSGDAKIRVFETEHFNEQYTLKGHSDSVTSLAFSPNANKLLLSGGKDAHLMAWDLKNAGEQIVSIPAHNYAIYGIQFAKDGKHFVTVSRDKTLKYWDSSSLTVLKRFDFRKDAAHKNSVNCLLAIGERHFISAGDDSRIIAWELS